MRILVLIWLVSLTVAAPVFAQGDYPALYDVTGVTAGDVLNIRSGPSATAPVIGMFQPNETGIEVIATDPGGSWGQVNTGEMAGWTSLRYLNRQDGNPDYAFAQNLQCFGTEPFWSLDLMQGQGATLAFLGEPDQSLPAGLLNISENRRDRFVTGLGAKALVVVSRGACSDGMSDRQYGLSVDLVILEPGIRLLSGCCSLSPN